MSFVPPLPMRFDLAVGHMNAQNPGCSGGAAVRAQQCSGAAVWAQSTLSHAPHSVPGGRRGPPRGTACASARRQSSRGGCTARRPNGAGHGGARGSPRCAPRWGRGRPRRGRRRRPARSQRLPPRTQRCRRRRRRRPSMLRGSLPTPLPSSAPPSSSSLWSATRARERRGFEAPSREGRTRPMAVPRYAMDASADQSGEAV